MRYCLHILFILLLFSCSRMPLSIGTNVKDSSYVQTNHIVVESLVDTSHCVTADSSTLTGTIGWDTATGFFIHTITDFKPGKHVTAKAKIEKNILTVDCDVDSFSVFMSYKSVHEIFDTSSHHNLSTITVTTVEVNRLNWWQKLQIYSARILALLVIGLVAGKIIKNKKSIPKL